MNLMSMDYNKNLLASTSEISSEKLKSKFIYSNCHFPYIRGMNLYIEIKLLYDGLSHPDQPTFPL